MSTRPVSSAEAPTACAHDWQPVPLCVALYHCALCDRDGRRGKAAGGAIQALLKPSSARADGGAALRAEMDAGRRERERAVELRGREPETFRGSRFGPTGEREPEIMLPNTVRPWGL